MTAKTSKQAVKNNVALETLTIDYAAPGDCLPNPYNPNRQSEHEFELLCRSIQEDGFTQPILAVRIDETHCADPKFTGKYKPGDLVVVDGYHRSKAAGQLGLAKIPFVLVPMQVAQMRISTLRHNRARGSEDIELSAEVLRDLRKLGALEWAQDSLMLDDTEMERLLDDVPAPEALADDEFSEAWVPDKRQPADVEQDMIESADRSVAASTAAAEKLRQMERKIEDAKTEQDKEAARKEADVFRLVLVFTGDQAALVKGTLGNKPAEAVLRLCEQAAAAAT